MMIMRALSLAVRILQLHRDPVRYFRGQGAEIGPEVEIYGARLFTFGSEPYLVTIGRGVTISHDVDFITHDGGLRVARAEHPGAYLDGRIQIGDGCFLGAHSVFLPGASVGAGSVIGAGAARSRSSTRAARRAVRTRRASRTRGCAHRARAAPPRRPSS